MNGRRKVCKGIEGSLEVVEPSLNFVMRSILPQYNEGRKNFIGVAIIAIIKGTTNQTSLRLGSVEGGISVS